MSEDRNEADSIRIWSGIKCLWFVSNSISIGWNLALFGCPLVCTDDLLNVLIDRGNVALNLELENCVLHKRKEESFNLNINSIV